MTTKLAEKVLLCSHLSFDIILNEQILLCQHLFCSPANYFTVLPNFQPRNQSSGLKFQSKLITLSKYIIYHKVRIRPEDVI